MWQSSLSENLKNGKTDGIVVSQEFVVFRGVAESGSDHDGAYTGGGRRTVEGAGDGKNRDAVVAARQGVGGVDVGVVGCVERGGVGLAEEGGWRALAGLTHPDALMGGGHPMDVGVVAVAQLLSSANIISKDEWENLKSVRKMMKCEERIHT
nr:hypothetical protein Iba_chr03eCG4130 [Ipomoea batatas]